MPNAGLGGLPIGIDCAQCGKPITVDYIAHGEGTAEELTSDDMREIVVAAARMAIGPSRLCSTCAPPKPIHPRLRRPSQE